MMRPINILTINVQGIRGSEARTLFFQWLLCVSFDIVCLQETHATSIQEFSSWVEDYNARALPHKKLCCKSSPGSARSCGVAILYRPDFQVLNVMTLGVWWLSYFLATTSIFRSCAFMLPTLGMKGVNFLNPFIAVLTLTFRL